jgi:putative membrane protein
MLFYGVHGGWTGGLGLGSVVLWVLAAVAIATLVRLLARGHRLGTPGPATPDQILAERFARGEISQDEFYERVAPHPGPATLPS